MLKLFRKVGESLTIGDLKLTVLDVNPQSVKMVMAFPDKSIQYSRLPHNGMTDWKPEPGITICSLQRAGSNQVQLGIEAPRHIQILRDNAKKRDQIGEVVACA